MSTATATEDDVNMGAVIGSILAAIAIAVVVFMLTHNALFGVIAYIVAACTCYALTWVMT